MTTMNTGWAAEARREAAAEAHEGWWLFLFSGVAWFVFAAIVLSFSYSTVWAIAIFFGIGLLFAGITEFAAATVMPRRKWLHALLGAGAVVAGVLALAWPSETFVILSYLIGWYLLARGVIDIIAGMSTREVNDLWWLGMFAGIAEAVVGLWAIGYQGRSMILLAVWVGAGAIFKGVVDLSTSFEMRSLNKMINKT